MNEWLTKLLNQVKDLWGKWSPTQKIILFSVIGVSVLAIILLAVFSSRPSVVPLLGTPITDEKTMERIITKLDEEIPGKYQVRPDNTIVVSDDRTAKRIRAILIREDLIPAQTDPWEIFDVDRWTLTDFERKVNLRRAITKNLEQHIAALDDVDAVQLIIDIPEDALFNEDQKPYTASIQLTPKPGSDIVQNRKKIEGIVKLIKFAVAGLKDENIVITDQYGIQLNDFEGLQDVDRLELAKREINQKAKLERDYKREVLAALEEFFTPDRVEVLKLELDLDMSKEKSQTKEFFPITLRSDNPKTPFDESQLIASTTLSSEEKNREWQGTGINPEGPPGQEGQTPPDYKDLSNFVGHLKETSSIKNEAINERNTEREERPWRIKRVTVGIAIDGFWKWKYDDKGNVILLTDGSIDREYKPVSDAELATVEALVKDAIGYSQVRGDSVTVKHLQKDRRAQHRQEEDVFRRQKQIRQTILWSL
ncbi:MAG TPA: flagellar basal-body MS-ring/collar protein FliF, partial [Spirochaetia bacterium]|nr:flagellar basal-body MS-ring/collar protein FliF [Spirochaetia bacterium]